MNTILVTMPLNSRHRERLEQKAKDCKFEYIPESGIVAEDVQAADIIVGRVPPEYIRESSRLKLLQLASAGTDGYTAAGVLAERTVLTNATGAYGKSVAEHMFAMMMALQKKLHLYRDDQFNGAWNDYGEIVSIADSTVLIIGLGDIGLHFAGMAKALGAYVTGIKRRPSACPQQVDELHYMSELDQVLPKADVVFSILPNTPQTRGIYNEEFFAKMKNSAVFLNAGRGNAVDQKALAEAIRSGELAFAGLDVTDPEPLPPGHPLWQEANVFITPHASGQFHLPETLDRIVEIAAFNIEACLTGKPLKNIVDLETGYCK